MIDIIITDGDNALFMPVFGTAVVAVRPGKIMASGKTTVNGKKVCLAGDEKKVEVPGCVYVTPQFVIPGTGTLKIAALDASQLSKIAKDSGKYIILKGSVFTAKFEVQSPAKDLAVPPKPDPLSQYSGSGNFISTNIKVKAE
ncbi:hypothetical protein SNE26_08195 [Mucilaginibacter sp. cycad4]|uniref:hypothetical protein n=1 Tax=Mucilaginibacter sp. cycad4 TaxID=3342096 RepID=UPI002AABEE10|nr:hypothetical protein [Mucilaginibacter gossypii]WPV01750.1 hypothetical protein SNE26_08195 [Mucilaginibacter gossypii]